LSLSIPASASDASKRSMIGFGFSDSKSGDIVHDFSLRNIGGGTNRLLSASVPMEVTSVQYSVDSRVTRDVLSVDEDSILQRMKQVKVREFAGSDNTRVRGVIGQELAEVFPELVTIIPEYTVAGQDAPISDFHQLDKSALTMDLIASMQSMERRFSVGSSTSDRTGSVQVSSSDGSESRSSGGVTVTTGASSVLSGSVSIATGASGSAGSVSIAPGSSSSSAGSSVKIVGGGSTVSVGGNVDLLSGAGASGSGSLSLSSESSLSGVAGLCCCLLARRARVQLALCRLLLVAVHPLLEVACL